MFVHKSMRRLFLLLWSSSLVLGIIFPSMRVKSCDSNTDECQLSVILLVTVDKEGSDWAVDFTFDEEITDYAGRVFRPASPVFLTFRKQEQKTLYPLQWQNSYQNAFETSRPRNSGQQCATSSTEICCSNSIRSLDHNSTVYEEFLVLNPRTEFSITIQATQDEISYDLILSHSQKSDSLPGVKAQLTISAVQNPPVSISSRFIIPATQPESMGFLVPSYFFGSRTNQIGISETAWALDASCNYPEGYLVSVYGGSIYDQFSKFRDLTMESFMRTCTWKDNWSRASRTGASQQGFDCNHQQTEIVTVEIASTNIRLIRLFAEPQITDQGMLPIHSGDPYVYLFVDVMNVGGYGSTVTLELTSCTPDIPGAYESIELWLEPQKTERYQFRIRSEDIVGITGECTVAIVQHGETSLETVVSFTAISINVPNLEPISYSDDDDCYPPSQIITVNGILYCQHPCSSDEEIKDGELVCTPVNCAEKYAGAKDFFNFATGNCEPVAICTYPRVLNEATNECAGSSGAGNNSPSPVPTLGSPSPSSSRGRGSNPLTPVPGVIDCGEHGEAVEGGTSCRCDAGWVSNPNQDIFSFQWCTVPYQPPANGGNGTAGGNQPDGSPSGLLGLLTSKYVVVPVIIIVIIVIAICSLLFVVKFRRKLLPLLDKFFGGQSNSSNDINLREGINPYTNPRLD